MAEKLKNEKILNLTPRVVDCLKAGEMTTGRIVALYHMGRLDLLKDLDGITDTVVYKLRTALTPEHPVCQEHRWVYHLALSAFFGDYGLSTLLYAEPDSKPLIDRVIIATIGTEEVALDCLRRKLKAAEREVIEDIFRRSLKIPDVARRHGLTETRVRQIYHAAMDKLGDEDTGVADDLLTLVFSAPDSENRSELAVIDGRQARLA